MAEAVVYGLAKDRDEVVVGQARILRTLATVAPGLPRRVLEKAG